MIDEASVTLDVATPSDQLLLANLLELYIHDLSAAFPDVVQGPDGRFGYKWLPLYWSEPDRRMPFIIRHRGTVAGFVLATRGSPSFDDAAVLDVAEFFVLRRFRRAGVGRAAARLLWQRMPGHWVVRVSEGSPGALPFWREVIGEFSGGSAMVSVRPGDPHPQHVFDFVSAG
ncbi:MAG: GNAT family N-acetyltransferase [Gemmatimonadota bacterium]